MLKLIINKLYSWIYDILVAPYTCRIYETFLSELEPGSSVLDIGMGNGTAVMHNKMWIVSKNLHIDGYDIDPVYVAECQDSIKLQNMTQHVTCTLKNVYDADINAASYDYVVFSSTYAVIPNVPDMVRHSRKYLNKDGTIIIMTTLFDYYNPFSVMLKPKLKYFLGADFGRFVTRTMIRQELESDFDITKFEPIHTTMFGSVTYLLKLKPKAK